MNKQKLLLLLMTLLSAKCSWSQTYLKFEGDNATSDNFNYSVCESANRYFTSGSANNSVTGTLDISVTCRDNTGALLWARTIDLGNTQDFSGKVEAVDSGIIIIGTSGDVGDNFKQVVAIHINKNGTIVDKAFFTPSAPFGMPNTYGFDVVYDPDDQTFVMVGMGDYPDPAEDEYEQRFAWVMKVSYNLQTVIWSNYYTTDPMGKGSWYDCFNSIQRISNMYGTYYYITGSVTDFNTSNSWLQDQAVANLLIDPSGTLIWDNPFRETAMYNPFGARQYARGTSSLYSDQNSQISLLYHSSWGHGNALAQIDYATGNVLTNTWFEPFGQSEFVESNMQWSDPMQQQVVIAGFTPTSQGMKTYLMSVDPVNPLTYFWQYYYPPTFPMADLLAINYDWVLKPMINNNDHMQRFFAPNMLANVTYPNPSNPKRLVCSIAEKAPGTPFDNLLIQTDPNGNLVAGCQNTSTYYQASPLNIYTVSPTYYNSFTFTQSPASTFAHKPSRTSIPQCVEGVEGKGSHPITLYEEINVYPVPASSEVSISYPAETTISKITLIDVLGNKIPVSTTSNGDNQIKMNISALASGVYTLLLETNHGVEKRTLSKL